MHAKAMALRTIAALVQITKDSYSNPAAKLGAGQPNLLNAAQYPINRITRDYTLMTSLYRNDWICKRIIDTVAEDMTKSWVKINSQIDVDMVKRFENVVKKMKVRDKIQKALKWSRLYGGSGAVIMIKGHEDIMDTPLDLDTVMPGSFGGLIVLDRWDGINPTGELVEEMGDPEFGQPKFFQIGGQAFGGTSMIVHHSRVLTFHGRELPVTEEVGENYWGASEMEHIFEELNKRNTSSANIAQLLFQANLRVMKTRDMAEQLATLDPDALKEAYRVAQAQNELMSSFGIQFMDADDSFETHQYTFSGIAEVYKTFMNDISGAAEIPATRLFGRSPDGMNSTGESDLTNYYDSNGSKQERDLRPALEKLFPVICVSTFGALPDDFDFEFNSVRSSSEAERADLAKSIVDSVLAAYNADIIDKPTAMQELRKSSTATGLFGSITDEQIDTAKQEAEAGAEQPSVPTPGEIGVQSGDNPPGSEAAMATLGQNSKTPAQGSPARDSFAVDFDESKINRQENGRFGPKEGPDTGGGTGGRAAAPSLKGPQTNAGREMQKAICAKHPKINSRLQNQHINAESAKAATMEEQKKLDASGGGTAKPKSYFTIKMQAAHDIVRDRISKGDFEEVYFGGQTHLKITLDKSIGMRYDKKAAKYVSTKNVVVAYSKTDGYHIWPSL